MYAFLPLGQRALTKLSTLIDEGMKVVGAQKVLLPALTAGHLWKKTGMVSCLVQLLLRDWKPTPLLAVILGGTLCHSL